ncbi:PKS-NRPS hybrid synthetase cheA-like [Rhododendron vialii]|uniref:PKS-NRPS hybrid synthetase cheA-like n=1 Tax=Rhododendron vialii TaxID=182163 RepID=UPI00265EA6AC|nr:PKS-NRPS hybrid synthetase cheA-like [Rhododendron vialii]
MEGSSPSIDPFFDPLVGFDFEIESNFIDNHIMGEEKNDIVMDTVSWKPREEFFKGFVDVSGSNRMNRMNRIKHSSVVGYRILNMFSTCSYRNLMYLLKCYVILAMPNVRQLGDASTHGSHIGPVTIAPECTTENVSAHGSHIGPMALYDLTREFTTENVFASEDMLRDWITSTGKENGFVIIIKSAERMTKNRRPRMRFACERGGKFRPFINKAKDKGGNVKENGNGKEAKAKKIARVTGTKKCECPFQLRCVKGLEGWTVTVYNGNHNHPPAKQLEGHAYPARLSLEQSNMLVDMCVSSLSTPREILSLIKGKDEFNVSSIKTIYNARYKHGFKDRAGRSQMQYLLAKLQEYGYIEFNRKDDNDCVKDLFWSHPTSGDMLRAFPRVLLMDCTYKTNRYRFPLLQIVGITSTERTFSAAFAFIDGEKEENYTWVLEKLKSIMDPAALPGVIVTDRELALVNAITRVFPTASHLLCRWHIGQNVYAKCRKMFDETTWALFKHAWDSLVYSPTISLYEQTLCTMKREFVLYPDALLYVETNWLGPYRQKFVSAWTNNVMHFGNLTSNRVESEHAKLKSHVANCQANFSAAWAKMHDLVKLQITDIKGSFEKSLNCWQHQFRIPIFDHLRGATSQTAMGLMLPEIKKIDDMVVEDKVDCGCPIRRIHGLPCAHEIAPFKNRGEPIPLSLINDHWKMLSFEKHKDDGAILKLMNADWNIFMAKMVGQNPMTHMHWMKTLKPILNPSTISLSSPQQKVQTRGRKSGSVNKSMRRNPSEFEYVEASLETPKSVKEKTPKAKAVVKKRPKANAMADVETPDKTTKKKSINAVDDNSPKGKAIVRTPKAAKELPRRKKPKLLGTLFVGPYLNNFPEPIRPHVKSITDVTSDGNCGYRAVAYFMHQFEHNWKTCRNDLLLEVNNHYDLYEKITGIGGANKLRYRLSFFQDGTAPEDRWMIFPDMGHVVASTYNVVVVLLSQLQCLTFLPLHSRPPSSDQIRVLGIGLVNGDHFVQVDLKACSPVPPIANNWFKFRWEEANEWETLFSAEMEAFKAIIGSDVATAESIDVD